VKRILALSPDLSIKGFVNIRPDAQFTFPGGERHVDISSYLPSGSPARLKAYVSSRLETSDDLMDLLLAVDALQRRYVGIRIAAYLPYIPYGRQDRYQEIGTPFSLAVAAQLINSCNFASVHTLDPHSRVTRELIKNLRVMPIDPFYMLAIDNLSYEWDESKGIYIFNEDVPVFVAPDEGAATKLPPRYLVDDGEDCSVIYAKKTRDPLSGMVTPRLDDLVWTYGSTRPALIIDDICDGGASFTTLARALKAAGAPRVYLFVTHGIFSKGLQPLRDAGIDRVFTTNSRSFVPSTDEDQKFLSIYRIAKG